MLNESVCRIGEQTPKWYKFDDGEVSECKMEDDEEMKNQCFGGEYLGEVFDHMLKRFGLELAFISREAYCCFAECHIEGKRDGGTLTF